MTSDDALENAMRRACAEGRAWLGATSPNPPVGAVALDRQGNILATAAHKRAGTAHAETLVIEECRAQGILTRLDTLCATLEPCNHQGRTPPCTEAIIRAGIRRVAFGARDCNPHVQGGGAERLRQAGIEVVEGVNTGECLHLMHAFAHVTATGKPWITVKRALDEKGSMIPPPGQKTFTSEESLRLAHRLRKKCDALLTGSGTILADNPLFTVRLVHDFPRRRRILALLDRRRRIPQSYLDEAKGRGFEPVIYDSIHEALDDLASRGAQDILVEAGPSLSQAVLDSGLWAISITVTKGNPDTTEVLFNPLLPPPFDPQDFRLEWMLPG